MLVAMADSPSRCWCIDGYCTSIRPAPSGAAVSGVPGGPGFCGSSPAYVHVSAGSDVVNTLGHLDRLDGGDMNSGGGDRHRGSVPPTNSLIPNFAFLILPCPGRWSGLWDTKNAATHPPVPRIQPRNRWRSGGIDQAAGVGALVTGPARCADATRGHLLRRCIQRCAPCRLH